MPQKFKGLPEGVKLRSFSDFEETRHEILNRVRESYVKKFPVENEKYKIELSDVHYPEKQYDVRDEKDALLKGNSLSLPLFGSISLVEKDTGEVLDQKQGVLARVPWMTHRGTYINSGNEYSLVAGQQRLKPGVYARRKDNGELESFVNTVSGTGQGFRFFMEPETGVFRVMVGKSRIPMYPVLKGLGIEDEQIEKFWGPDILKANKKEKEDNTSFDKFYKKLMGRKFRAETDPKQRILDTIDELKRGEIDEEVSTRTLGSPYKNLSPEVFLRSSQKLMNIHRGSEEEDDRDSLANKIFMGQEDLFEERIMKDTGKLAQKLLSRSSYNRKLTGFQPGYFSPQLGGLVSGNSLSVHIDGINPIQILDFSRRVVQTGDGAIGDADAIPMSSRALHPSQVMAIDPIKTPESGSVGVDQRYASAAMKGSDKNIYFPLINKKTGETEYVTPVKMSQSIVGFPKHKRLLPDAEEEVYGDTVVAPEPTQGAAASMLKF